MVDYQQDDREINLIDVFAYWVKEFGIICICAFVGVALGFGINYIKIHSTKNIEKYQRELARYEQTMNALESELSSLETLKTQQIARNSEDPVMDIAGKTVFTTTISFRVASEDGQIYTDKNGVVINVYAEKVLAYWKSINLTEAFGSNYKDEYIRQIVSLAVLSSSSSSFSEFLELKVRRDSYQSAEETAEKAVSLITKFCMTLDGVVVSDITKVTEEDKSSYIQNLVYDKQKAIYDYEEQIAELEDKIASEKKNEPHLGGFSKSILIGFFVAVFLITGILFCSLVVSDKVTNSSDATKRLGVPLLGALYSDNGFFDKLARVFMHERRWANEKDAIRWFAENLNETVLASKSRVALLYSGADKKAGMTLVLTKEMLEKKGYTVHVVDHSFQNPDLNGVVQSADSVILLEKQFVSKWADVWAEVETVKRFNKKLAGIVFC